jgi:Acyl-CoA synthetase (NDP forming)
MSTYRLDSIFRPRAVAVVGSQSRARSVGRAVVENLRAAGFEGHIGLVNRHPQPMDGVATVRSLRDLPWTPDLVVIATPAATVPQLAAEAAEKAPARSWC